MPRATHPDSVFNGTIRTSVYDGMVALLKEFYGVGPTQARQAGAVLRSQPRMSFRLVVEGNTSMDYRIVTKDAFRLAGLTARVPLVHEGMNPHIVAFVRGIDPATVSAPLITTLVDATGLAIYLLIAKVLLGL